MIGLMTLNGTERNSKRPRRSSTIMAALASSLMLLCGCQPQLQQGYGRAGGLDHFSSVNGTIVFHKMLAAGNRRVRRYSQFSPRWEKHQTVYWMPNSFQAPQENIVTEIENWLANGPNRTLVYVCRDYDATMQYWEMLRDNEPDPELATEYRRFGIKAASQHFDASHIFQQQDAPWYQVKEHAFTRANQFSGELVDAMDTSGADVRYGTLASPGDVVDFGSFGDYDAEVLMNVNSHPFIYRLTGEKLGNSQIIVVGNASFLLNLSLINETNRKLAGSLIEYVGRSEYPDDDILFIESDRTLRISDVDSRESSSQWNWITKKPMRYIVPNLLISFILLCFVYFPIFGRPRKIKQESTSNFRDHIDALGQLVRNSKSSQTPKKWIDEYRRRTSRNRGAADDNTEPMTQPENKIHE